MNQESMNKTTEQKQNNEDKHSIKSGNIHLNEVK